MGGSVTWGCPDTQHWEAAGRESKPSQYFWSLRLYLPSLPKNMGNIFDEMGKYLYCKAWWRWRGPRFSQITTSPCSGATAFIVRKIGGIKWENRQGISCHFSLILILCPLASSWVQHVYLSQGGEGWSFLPSIWGSLEKQLSFKDPIYPLGCSRQPDTVFNRHS